MSPSSNSLSRDGLSRGRGRRDGQRGGKNGQRDCGAMREDVTGDQGRLSTPISKSRNGHGQGELRLGGHEQN